MRQDRKVLGVAVLVTLVVMGLAIAFLTTSPEEVVVAGHTWTREILVEIFLARRYGGWRNTVPSDAYDRTCYTKQSGSHQVKTGESCHEVCSGTGENRTCRPSCTNIYTTVIDYDTWCDYTADRWGYARSQVTSGVTRNDPPPFWATPDFTPCPDLGCEREGSHKELYRVTFEYGETAFTCPEPFADWGEYRIGDAYTLEVGTFIKIPRCETLIRSTPDAE